RKPNAMRSGSRRGRSANERHQAQLPRLRQRALPHLRRRARALHGLSRRRGRAPLELPRLRAQSRGARCVLQRQRDGHRGLQVVGPLPGAARAETRVMRHAKLLAKAENLLANDIPDGFIERHNGHLYNGLLGNTTERREWIREDIAVVRAAEALGLKPKRRYTLRWDEPEKT